GEDEDRRALDRPHLRARRPDRSADRERLGAATTDRHGAFLVARRRGCRGRAETTRAIQATRRAPRSRTAKARRPPAAPRWARRPAWRRTRRRAPQRTRRRAPRRQKEQTPALAARVEPHAASFVRWLSLDAVLHNPL